MEILRDIIILAFLLLGLYAAIWFEENSQINCKNKTTSVTESNGSIK